MLVLHTVQQTSSSSESTKTITELLSSLSICFEDKFVREKCMNEQLVFSIDSANNSIYCLIVVEYVSKLNLSVFPIACIL